MKCHSRMPAALSQETRSPSPPDAHAADPRAGDNERQDPLTVAPLSPRKERGRPRRKTNPATCARDYKSDEIQFIKAMDQYKRDNGRQFPTWSEALEVLCALGYRKVAEPTPIPGLATTTSPKAKA
jgi:hypothetical protein